MSYRLHGLAVVPDDTILCVTEAGTDFCGRRAARPDPARVSSTLG